MSTHGIHPSRLSKSFRLLQEGRVKEVTDARIFRVEGDNGTYTVVIGQGVFRYCECKWNGSGACSHILAANNFITQDKFDDNKLSGLPSPEHPFGRPA